MEPKLYVIVRNDLSRSQKAVQAIHAAADFLIYEREERESQGWDNGTVICSRVSDENELIECEKELKKKWVSFCTFKEPDIGDQKTATAYISTENLFPNLPLL